MRVCVVGHGMMGERHSVSLRRKGCHLQTLVGRRAEPTEEFARRHGYANWTLDALEAMTSPLVDVVIIAGPSATHAEMALAAIAAKKHVLIEIPIAMSLVDAERVVQAGEAASVAVGVVHPMRFKSVFRDLAQRIGRSDEHLCQVQARIMMHRLENIGSTGYRRSWTDNLLWHHMAHILDLALWLGGGGDTALALSQLADFQSVEAARRPLRDLPMDIVIQGRLGDHALFTCTGSYQSKLTVIDATIVTDREAYAVDGRANTVTNSAGRIDIDDEEQDNADLVWNFIDALSSGEEPGVTGRSVLPTMRLLQRVQDSWDARNPGISAETGASR